MMTQRRWLVPVLAIGAVMSTAHAAELVQLNPGNVDRYAPAGKEADAIYGDFVLRRNEAITAVVAAPIPLRNANMMVRDVDGMIIDLTTNDPQSD